MNRNYSRRRLLRTGAVAASAGVAGCADLLDESEGDRDADDGSGDTDGASDGDETTPSVTAVVDPVEGTAPTGIVARVDPDQASPEANQTLTDVEWTIDGAERDGERVAYGFEREGTYDVALTATTADGETVEDRTEVTVGAPPDGRPLEGSFVPELAALDEAALGHMREHGIDAGALAVAREGEVLLERGYGWRDEARTEPTGRDSLFRIASVSKAVTDAAIDRLARDGELSYDDRVLSLVDLEPPSGSLADERMGEITVGHLQNHAAGWAHGPPADQPIFDAFGVAEELDLDRPPETEDFARYLLDRPLDFPPGEPDGNYYSNVGYALLELTVEAVAGRSFHEYVESAILEPAGIEDLRPGRTRPEDRPDREVWYDADRRVPDAVALDPDERVPFPDGGFVLEAMTASGGYVASAGALVRFATEHWLTGPPRDGADRDLVLLGSLPGTFAVARQRPDGIDAVALFNRRTRDDRAFVGALDAAIDELVELSAFAGASAR